MKQVTILYVCIYTGNGVVKHPELKVSKYSHNSQLLLTSSRK
jgi:hypothetical protein